MGLGYLDEQTAASIAITAGAYHAAPGIKRVFAQLPAEHTRELGVMDNGYDSNKVERFINRLK